jgi:hypothetical protein
MSNLKSGKRGVRETLYSRRQKVSSLDLLLICLTLLTPCVVLILIVIFKPTKCNCTLFLLLFHFTPTCFDVRNVIFREGTKSSLHLLAGSMCCLRLLHSSFTGLYSTLTQFIITMSCEVLGVVRVLYPSR